MESFVLFIPWDVSQDKGGSGEGWGFRMGEGEGEEVCQGGGVVGGLALALAG